MQTAFVTGASRGIGKGLALALAALGYRVALVATHKARLEEVADAIAPCNPLLFSLDVSDEKALKAAIQKTYDTTGRIDVLVNGAGVLHEGGEKLSSTDLHNMLDVNALGAFYAMQAVVPFMKEQRSGHIINIASRAGKRGIPRLAGYCASKFALMGMNEAFFNALAAYRIKVTAICPGWVDTDMAQNARVPPEERISVEDICSTLRYLLSLSPNCCIRECVLECRKSVERENSA